MLTERISSIRLRELMVVVLAALAWAGVPAAEAASDPNAAASAPLTSQVFRFNKVTPAQAALWLKKLDLGATVSEIRSANALIVTCSPADLPKVRTMLKYLDTLPDVTVKVLSPLPSPANWPSNKAIQAKLKDMAVGTFKDPPAVAPGAVVVDEHGGYIVGVGTRGDLEKLIETITLMQGRQGPAAEPNVQPAIKNPSRSQSVATSPAAPSSDDKLFDKMIETLSRQEEAAKPVETNQVAPSPGANESATPPADADIPTGMSQAKRDEIAREMIKKASGKAHVEQKQAPAVAPIEAPEESLSPEVPVDTNQPAAAGKNGVDFPGADLELELQLPDRLEVIDLLDLLGKYLRLNYMFDETIIKGQAVNLRVQGKIKVRDLYAIAENVLRFKGLVMSRSGDLVTITQMATNQPSQGKFVTGVEGIKPGDAVVTRIFQLRYASTGAVKTLLTSLKFANGGQGISEIPETGTLVITDYSLAMPKIEEILAVVDKPGEDRVFKFIKLKYTMARNLAPKLKDLAEQLGTISISVSSSAAPTPTYMPGQQPGAPRTPIARPAVIGATGGGGSARPGVFLDYDDRTNRLLIVGRKDEIALVERLINDLDVAQQDLRTLKQYSIQHVDTTEVLTALKEQGIITDAPQTTSRITSASTQRRVGVPAPVPGQPDNPQQQQQTSLVSSGGTGPVVEPPLISVIAATNSLLINATAEQHVAIGQIIAYVDQERGESSINYVVYPLENQDPEKLKSVLESLITGRTIVYDKEKKVERSSTTRQPNQPYQPGPQPAQQPVASAPTTEAAEQEITIVADPSTYSLIIYASKKNQQWISSVIKELDQYRPQVLLDCTLVEISRDDAFTLDVQLISKEGAFNGSLERLPAAAPFGTFPPKGILEATGLSGTGTVFFGDKSVQALITAMQQKQYGRVMSRPQILVNDNEEGTIKAENTVYIPNQKTNYINSSNISGGAISTPVQDVTFDAYPAGITLTITPHISKGNNLRLQILLDRKNQGDPTTVTLSDGSKVTAPPNQTSNNVTSVVTVPDSATIILGGLESLNQSKGGTKVPVLGDIPLIGGLFRSTNNKDQQTKLYVFIKAHILRPGDDAGASAVENVSRPKIEGFEKMERDFEKYQDWPGLPAQPMQPEKVLEDK
jgi:type II secretory pathway component GspD/PulD (secretin)